jgi:lysozyme family protein
MTLTEKLANEYQTLWDTLEVTGKSASEAIEKNLLRINANMPVYQEVERQSGKPWRVVAVIHYRESSFNFNKHLHNGDPLTERTKRVPRGRPVAGKPPFTWLESAVDALRMKPSPNIWTIAETLYFLETYNGFGYRNLHPEVLSPYLWSWSTHYKQGLYVADHVFNPLAVDMQCGCALLLQALEYSKGYEYRKDEYVPPVTVERSAGVSEKLIDWVISKADFPKLAKIAWLWALRQANAYVDSEIAKLEKELDGYPQIEEK